MTQNDLIQSEFDIYFDLSPDLIYRIDRTGRILSSRIGKKALEFNFGTDSEDICASLEEGYADIFKRSIKEAIELQKETSLYIKCNKKGQELSFSVSIAPFGDAEAVAIFRPQAPISDVFQQFEPVFRSLGRNVPRASLVLFDKDLRYRLMEGQVVNQTPFSSSDMEGQTVYELLKPPQLDIMVNAYKKALAGESSVIEILSESGYWYQASISPFYYEGKIEGGIALFLDITEFKQVHQTLKDSLAEAQNRERVYKTLVENIPNAALVMFDMNMRYTFFEGPALSKLGFLKESMLGKTPAEAFPPEVANYLIPAYKKALKGTVSTFNTQGINTGNTYLITVLPALDNDNNIIGGMVASFDIDYLKNTESELQAKVKELEYSRSVYRALANNLPNGAVILFNDKLDHTLAAGKAIELAGVAFDDIEGKNLDDFKMDEERRNFLRTLYQKALAGETISYEYQLDNGQWVYLTILPFEIEGSDEKGGMIVAFDIHQQKETEKLLEEHLKNLANVNEKLKKEIRRRQLIERDLQEYTAELRAKNEELEQFAYIASHDLQEPLRMVSSFTQLLSNKYGALLDGTAHEYIGFAIEGAKRMQSLINGLLEYSRAGRKLQPFEVVELNEAVEAAKHNLGLRIEDTHASLVCDRLPVVQGNFVQLVQLFQNLIGNALKFRKEDATPRIEIRTELRDGMYTIYVKDNGIGFSPEHKEKIFLIFQRLHTRDKYEGTGIGLAMCRKIVELHGGRIWANSVPGEGAEFCFSIPAPPEPA